MKHTLLLDASLLKESECDCKINYIHNRGLITSVENYKMSYGTAGHKFIASYLRGLPIKDSIKLAADYYMTKCHTAPIDDFRTIEHLIKTLQEYPTVYPLNTDSLIPLTINEKVCIELPFAMPLHALLDTLKFEHIFEALQLADTEVMIVGTIDQIGEIKYESTKVIVDNKFTAIWDSEGYFQEQALGYQMKFYSWFVRKSGLFNSWLSVIINGIFIKKPTAKSKDKLTGKLIPVVGWNGAIFKRSSLITFDDERMENFENFLAKRILNFAENIISNRWEQNNNMCGTKFGMCQFAKICSASKDIREEIINSTSYSFRKYDPAEFQT